MLSRPKLPEIDIVRAIAILAVLLIHGTSGATLLPLGTVSQAVFFTLNQASLFTVPLFIWISGVVLFYTYYDRWEPGMSRTFWTKRLRKILIPYVLWSIFYYLYNQFMFHGTIHFNVIYLLKLLLSGNASYHLYYMIIIVQFYLLFPWMMTLVKRSPRIRQLLIPIGIGLQAAGYSFHHWITPIPEYASLFISYTALFAFGAFMGIHYSAIINWANHNRRWIYGFTVLTGTTYTLLLLLHQYSLISLENTWFELALLAYCLAVPLCVDLGARQLLVKETSLSRFATSIGTASFGIYLLHPALLTLWDLARPEQESSIGLYDWHTIGSILIGLIGSWLFVLLYTRIVNRRT
ncbi:acyltransferase [Paenibacillus sp. HWE-109]|uniref:acyltransferase n=1 Tax=Paenibacillus sp. HWE-109 TaxID=1306526 RepID=UPI001EDDDD48|nr:acyltransferase [Paenibacillus sp. HWE-109]UKS24170.1 acyltransferase [Paenibacillus sp. HWE-109]